MQENFTEQDYEALKAKIQDWTSKYNDKINHSHISVWHQGDEVSNKLAIQIAELLKNDGYVVVIDRFALNNAKPSTANFDVSNAPDDSILVEVYPFRAI